MYRLINENLPELFNSIDQHKIIDPYCELVRAVRDMGVPLGVRFKQIYRKYWAMNAARLGEPFDDGYFARLDKCRKGPRIDVHGAAMELISLSATNLRPSVQFSFATKLVHMVHSDRPIYDRNIRSFLFLPSVETLNDPKAKLLRLMAHHDALIEEYRSVLQKGQLKAAIDDLRAKFKLAPSDYSDTKAIDTLIWSFVTFIRRHPLGKRALSYS